MLRKVFQGGSSKKKSPRRAIGGPSLEPPREASMQPCEWPPDHFMGRDGFKDEFYVYIQNAELTNFLSDKCP